MSQDHVTVVYKWTAQPGKLEQLTEIYRRVTEQMQATEPGAEAVEVFVSEAENALYVRDEFTDADAVGFHLTNTAAGHFPDLLAIATPGPFFFMGELPEGLRQATEQMQLGAEFSSHAVGFAR